MERTMYHRGKDQPKQSRQARRQGKTLGRRARLFVKNIQPERSEYMSEYVIEFDRNESHN
ncbi:MAG TPA: hypothetical protein VJ203_02825 [Bacteroidales bacterium]|nr:hypothetical protein [Bacteroidales bacterium]